MADPTTTIRPGEIVVDSAKVANLVHEHRRLAGALHRIETLDEMAEMLRDTIAAAREALAAEPEYDAIPPVVVVDSSWADTLPDCCVCGQPVPWGEALLMPCSTVEDGDVDALGIVHRAWGCRDA